jgi:hypothetical protein
MVLARRIGPGDVMGAHYDRRPVACVLCLPNWWGRGVGLLSWDRGRQRWATSLDVAGAGVGFMSQKCHGRN